MPPSASLRRFIPAAAALLLAVSPAVPAPSAPPSTQSAAVIPAKAARASVVLLRGGVGGIFSHGLDQIGAKLAAKGVSTTVAGYGSAGTIARRLIEARKRGALGPVILVGHSFGADAITALATDLDRAGVRVDLLVSFAATAPRPVPRNVRRALNFYFSQGGWGLPLVPAQGFRGRLDNRDYSRTAGVGHFNIEKQAAVQAEVITAILAATRR
ncbi:MAG: lipase [Mesorhizobium amorphae]|nr:MAG: lipase [Mesorhizobium amorphae]